MNCLDYLSSHPSSTAKEIITQHLETWAAGTKDWRYYFLKYSKFREGCNQGYYYWAGKQYMMTKMKERQFNGMHWDPFLETIKANARSAKLHLYDYGGRLKVISSSYTFTISNVENGFQVCAAPIAQNEGNEVLSLEHQSLLAGRIMGGLLSRDGSLLIQQDEAGNDLEDRIEKGILLVKTLLNSVPKVIRKSSVPEE